MKEQLLKKITSLEQFKMDIGDPGWYEYARRALNPDLTHVPRTATNADTWWLAREYLRIDHEVYKTTPITEAINAGFLGQHCLHVSRDDPERIAFTMSREQGEADRQVIMSFGKYLRKYFLCLTGNQVAELEGKHRAYLNARLKIATTAEEIEFVYRNMLGDTGCMRHSKETFGTGDLPVHPSAVYEAPGMGVAYAKMGEAIVGRSVCWVNPDDPTDKRYVRMYGDHAMLGPLLTQAGFRGANLSGAKLRAIPIPSDRADNRWVMPYLDGVGGDQHKRNGTYAVLTEPEYFTLITTEQYTSLGLSHLSGSMATCKSTGGEVCAVMASGLTFISDLSQREFSELTHSRVTVLLPNGQTGAAARAEVDGWQQCYTLVESGPQLAWCDIGCHTFKRDSRLWLDTEANREYCGYKRLSQVYYPGEVAWIKNAVATVRGEFIVVSDAYRMLPDAGDAYYIHRSELNASRKLGFIKCRTPNIEVAGTMIHKHRTSLLRSDTGVVFDLTESPDTFVKLSFQTPDVWVNVRSVYTCDVFGVDVILSKTKQRLKARDLSVEQVTQVLRTSEPYTRLKEQAQTLSFTPDKFKQAVAAQVENLLYFKHLSPYALTDEGNVYAAYRGREQTLEELQALLLKMEEPEVNDSLRHLYCYNMYKAVTVAHTELLAEGEAVIAAKTAELTARIAEATSAAAAAGLLAWDTAAVPTVCTTT